MPITPLRVVASSPSLELSGANILVANLLEQFHRVGLDTEWILTGHTPTDDATWLGSRPFKIHRLPVTKIADVQQRQNLFVKFLEERAPCIYLPNFDFDMACVAPALSEACQVVLIIHCDDPAYYDFAARHGNLFSAIVCVSEYLAGKIRAVRSDLGERISYIPFGVKLPAALPLREKSSGQPLDVSYCGRISFYQKRVQDLARLINQCYSEKLPIRFQIAGTGPDERTFFGSIKEPLAAGQAFRLGFLSNPDVLKLLEKSDALVMTSEFEGLPMVLLEAMSRGCVPVVTQTKSGVGEVVQHGENGFLLPVGGVQRFVGVLAKLSGDSAALLRLRHAAFERIISGGFTLERAADNYRKLFESLVGNSNQCSVLRNGKPIIPSHYRFWSRTGVKIGALFNIPS